MSTNPLIRSYKEIILLLLYVKGKSYKPYESINGRTRLMKMIFLFKKELKKFFEKNNYIDLKSLPDFTAYDFGPFSIDVYSDLDFLKTNDFIEIYEIKDQVLYTEEIAEFKRAISEINLKTEDVNLVPEEFSLTPLGIEFTKTRLINRLTNNQIEVLEEFKKRCTEVSLKTLLKYVYVNYPETTTKSKIKKDILDEYEN